MQTTHVPYPQGRKGRRALCELPGHLRGQRHQRHFLQFQFQTVQWAMPAHCGRPHPIIRCYTASAEDKAWFATRPAPGAAKGAPKSKAGGKGKKAAS